ncbi:IclR family transcriptional regulator [Variovorax sp. RB2P76]|uniref:IclR family transcriptional regulator n=1 Tax=Variovorax sp. RB2P76 TaxID=3443736 RepID=UPI003F46D3C4
MANSKSSPPSSASSLSSASSRAPAATGAAEPDARLFIGSMEKGMSVLELFNEHDMPLSIGDIADHTHMGRSAAQRYVYTLHHLGYLNKDEESKRYFPALKLLGLVRGIHRHHSQRDLAWPLLQSLAAQTMETVSWVELNGDDVVVLQNIPGAHITAINLPVGSRFPALTSSSGQVLLSRAPQSQLAAMLDALPSTVRSRFGTRSRDEILGIFAKAAKDGYSFTEKNFSEDGVSVSAPVTDAGRIVAAINVSTVHTRFDLTKARKLILPKLQQAAREASI